MKNLYKTAIIENCMIEIEAKHPKYLKKCKINARIIILLESLYLLSHSDWWQDCDRGAFYLI